MALTYLFNLPIFFSIIIDYINLVDYINWNSHFNLNYIDTSYYFDSMCNLPIFSIGHPIKYIILDNMYVYNPDYIEIITRVGRINNTNYINSSLEFNKIYRTLNTDYLSRVYNPDIKNNLSPIFIENLPNFDKIYKINKIKSNKVNYTHYISYYPDFINLKHYYLNHGFRQYNINNDDILSGIITVFNNIRVESLGHYKSFSVKNYSTLCHFVYFYTNYKFFYNYQITCNTYLYFFNLV